MGTVEGDARVMKRRAIVGVTFDRLESLLGLPPGAILDVESTQWDLNNPRAFRIRISTPDCPQVPEGDAIPTIALPIVPGTYA